MEDQGKPNGNGPEHVNGAGAAEMQLKAALGRRLQAVTRRLLGGFPPNQPPRPHRRGAAPLGARCGATGTLAPHAPSRGPSVQKNRKTAKSRDPSNVLATYWPRIGRCAANTRIICVFGSAGRWRLVGMPFYGCTTFGPRQFIAHGSRNSFPLHDRPKTISDRGGKAYGRRLISGLVAVVHKTGPRQTTLGVRVGQHALGGRRGLWPLRRGAAAQGLAARRSKRTPGAGARAMAARLPKARCVGGAAIGALQIVCE
jgi:hypothetical protein